MSVILVPTPIDTSDLEIGSKIGIRIGQTGFDGRVFELEDAANFLVMSDHGNIYACDLSMILYTTMRIPIEMS